MPEIRFGKPVMAVRKIGMGPDGTSVGIVYRRGKTSKSKKLRPLEKTVVRLVNEQRKATKKYLRLHARSKANDPADWAEDYGKNVVKAYSKLDRKWVNALLFNKVP